MRETEPAKWARVAHVMLPKDYVRFRLTGERAIDMADASGTLLLDVTHRRWSSEVLSKTGIQEAMLPEFSSRRKFAAQSLQREPMQRACVQELQWSLALEIRRPARSGWVS